MDKLKELKDLRWRKTDHVRPHEYIVAEWHPEEFKAMVAEISAEGYWKKFGNTRYKYLNRNGYKYWRIQCVLNREKLEQ